MGGDRRTISIVPLGFFDNLDAHPQGPGKGFYRMYSTRAYGSMIADSVRMKAYTHALRQAIKPGDVVIDIGTGTGIFALLACKYGASRVYAIEPNENIRLARKLAMENQVSDRIEFIQNLSTRVHLGEKADVIISDLRGILPLLEMHIPAIMDARARLLRPGGKLIPRKDTLYVCIVEAPELYSEYADPWEAGSYDLNLKIAHDFSMNKWSYGRVKAEQALTLPQSWGALEYDTVASPHMRGAAAQEIVREGMAHGLMIWFDAELTDGIGFSNAPDSEEHPEVYGSAFFPFLRPVPVSENDVARIDIRAVLVGNEYTWCWDTDILSSGNAIKASFRQSTFYGTIFSPEDLRKRQPGHVPRLNPEGLIEQFILNEMSGSNSLEGIAKKMLLRFPGKFSTFYEALERAGDSSHKYAG